MRPDVLLLLAAIAGFAAVLAYIVYPALCRRSAKPDERAGPLPGDHVVPRATTGYTLATTIDAPVGDVWPWLVQLGQGRGGFYTHERVEALLGAKIKNAGTIIPALQHIAPGDRIRLTPDPYLGKPGQALVVEQVQPERALVLSQRLPNGTLGTWAFVLADQAGRTRLVFRRRGTQSSAFDRVMLPGFYFMDRGMLNGIRRRSERIHRRSELHAT